MYTQEEEKIEVMKDLVIAIRQLTKQVENIVHAINEK